MDKTGVAFAKRKLGLRFPLERPKPEGGFVSVSPRVAAKVFHECGPEALRFWLATHEVREWRRHGKDRTPSYTPRDWQDVLGGGWGSAKQKRVQRVLEEKGLLRIEKSSVWIPAASQVELPEEIEDLLRGIPARVPIPRRMLRQLSRCAKKCLLATALSHLFRCMRYYRAEKLCKAHGRTASSWVACVFGISERSAVRSRKILERDEWLIPIDSDGEVVAGEVRGLDKVHETRHGKRHVVNLFFDSKAASNLVGASGACQSPPELPTAQMSEPREQESSPNLPQDPELKQSSNTGVCTEKKEGAQHNKPTLANVRPEDLKSLSRTLALGEQALEQGWLQADAGRWKLEVRTLAIYARTYARSPERFFRFKIERGDFSKLSQEAEDRAREELRCLEYGIETQAERRAQRAREDAVRARQRQTEEDVRRLEILKACGEKLPPKALNFIKQHRERAVERQEEVPVADLLGKVLEGVQVVGA